VLKLIKVGLGAGVRPLTEDEHLYLRLCKLGELILFFRRKRDTYLLSDLNRAILTQ
jgi:hypothetical protein